MAGGAPTQESAVRAIVRDRNVSAVIGLALFVNLGTGMVLPILPLYARSFGVDYALAGLLVASFYVARLVFDLVAGVVLDRLGIASTAAVGLLVLGAGAALTGISPSFWIAVACWAAAGAGAAVVWAAMYNSLIRSVPKARMARTLSLFYGAFNGGIVAGGFLGGLLAGHFGLASPLFVLAGLGVVLAGLMKRLLPQHGTVSREPSEERRGSPLSLFRIPGFAAAVVSLLANLWLFGAVFNTLVPLYARDVLGLTPVAIGILYAIALAAEFLAYYPAGRWADTRGRRFVLIPAFACGAVASFVLGWPGNIVVFGLVLSILSIASGFAGVPPTAILADVLPANRSASGVAIFRFGGDLGFSLGPLLAGLTAAQFGFKAAFAVAGLPCLLALLVVTRARETLARTA